jgi:hypothetical protein
LVDGIAPNGSPHALFRALKGWETRRTIFAEVLLELSSQPELDRDNMLDSQASNSPDDVCVSSSRAAVASALAELVQHWAAIAETDAAARCMVLLKEITPRAARVTCHGDPSEAPPSGDKKAMYAAVVCVGRFSKLRTARAEAEEAVRSAGAALEAARVAAARGAATTATLKARPAESEHDESDDESDDEDVDFPEDVAELEGNAAA